LFGGAGRMSKLAPTSALSVDGSDYGWRWLRKERINPSLGAAGGKPARISLVGVVDRQGWVHDVSILIAGAGGAPDFAVTHNTGFL
jgi:hypothetical protein